MYQNGLRLLRLLALLACGLLVQSANAQFLSGITGIAHDNSGAVVPGAQVTLRNKQLGVTRTTTTNSEGFFRFDSLAASNYTVEVKLSGFQTWQDANLVLAVGDQRGLAPVLQVGEVSTSVTVTSEELSVNTSNARTGSVLSEETIHDSPLVGQNVYGLANLTPGVTGSAVSSGDNYNSEYAINVNASGLRQEMNGYQIDGAYTDTPSRGGGTSISPNPEIVQSINIETNSFDAQKGRNAGATIDVFTKSGTNQFHGTADYYFTNDSLTARTEFQQSLPTSQRNEYSGTLGGPIIKDKFFVFGAIDILRSSVADSFQATTETQDFVNWAKTNLPNTLGTKALLLAPPQVYPTTNFQTVAQAAATGHYPLPTGIPPTLNALGTANINYTVPRNGYQWNVRGDYYLGKNDRFYVEGMRTNETSEAVNARPNLSVATLSSSDFVNADYTHIFSPHLLNEGGATMIRPYGQNGSTPAFVIPFVNVTNMTGFSNWGPGNFTQTTVGWRDTLTASVKTHTLKVGFEEYNVREADQQQTGAGGRPTYNFNSLLDLVQDEAFSEAGAPVTLATGTQAQNGFYRRALYTGIYAQDDWKLSPRLTVNLGIRYDAMAHLFSVEGPPLTNFNFGTGSTLDAQIANGSVALTPHPWFVNHNPKYVTPRVGMAWDVFGTGKTSVRAGAGIFYDQPPFINMTAQTGNLPVIFTPSISVQQGQTPVFQFCQPASGNFQSCPVVDTSNVTLNSSGGASINGVVQRANIVGYDPRSTMSQVYTYTASVQQELQRDFILELNYSGSVAHHLPVLYNADINRFSGDLVQNKGQLTRLNPNFGTIGWGSTDANSTGNVGTVSLTRRNLHGLQIRGIYTFAKALDTYSTSGSLDGGAATTSTPVIRSFDLSAQRGRADYDIRHQLSIDGIWTSPSTYSSAFLRQSLGGWQLSGVWNIHTGLPFTVYTSAPFQPVFGPNGAVIGNTGGDYNADGFDYDLPNQPAFGNHLPGQDKHAFLKGLFPASAFPTPALGSEGNLGRNTFDQPGYNNLNFSFQKAFSVPFVHQERLKLEGRADVTNLLNRVNLNGVNSDLSSSLFGHSTNQYPARFLQLHLRGSF
jgi:hypothetical protein